MLENLNNKQKIIFFIILSIMIIFILFYIYKNLYNNDFSPELSNITTYEVISSSTENTIENSEDAILVYVCGAVKENKVIKLSPDSRVEDAINAAGGLTDNADISLINLAYFLEDGEKLYIPQIGEILDEEKQDLLGISTSSKKININKATQTELETIPGVGPSTALKIINYRSENGKFSSIEDIKNVSGIGDAKFTSMKDYICVK